MITEDMQMKLSFFKIIVLILSATLLFSSCTTQQQTNPFVPEESVDARLLEKINNSIELSSENATKVKVGETFYITLFEKPSVPYRWQYYISDKSLVRLFYDEYQYDEDSKPISGGDSGNHWFFFEALKPGECKIEMRDEHVGDGDFFQTHTYTVIIEE